MSALDAVADLVNARAGLWFATLSRDRAERAIRHVMETHAIPAPSLLRRQLEADPALFDELLAVLTVPETYFFREPDQLDLVRQELATRRDGARVWSAGCATGEEAYTLAMILKELGLVERSHVLATDISRPALAIAEAARYEARSFRGEAAIQARGHVRPASGGFVVHDVVRKAVTFRHLNLASDPYPAFINGTYAFDVIVCRNVFIYFDRATIARVASQFAQCLRPGGMLLLGAMDPLLLEHPGLESVTTRAGIVYRRPHQTIAPIPSIEEIETRAEPAAAPESPATESPLGPDVWIERLRTAANTEDLQAALALATTAVTRHPLSPELHYLRGLLQWSAGDDVEAMASLKRTLYLDRSLAVAHFLKGRMHLARGSIAAAARAFRRARDLCRAMPDEAPVALAEGERAGHLAAAAAEELARCHAHGGAS